MVQITFKCASQNEISNEVKVTVTTKEIISKNFFLSKR